MVLTILATVLSRKSFNLANSRIKAFLRSLYRPFFCFPSLAKNLDCPQNTSRTSFLYSHWLYPTSFISTDLLLLLSYYLLTLRFPYTYWLYSSLIPTNSTLPLYPLTLLSLYLLTLLFPYTYWHYSPLIHTKSKLPLYLLTLLLSYTYWLSSSSLISIDFSSLIPTDFTLSLHLLTLLLPYTYWLSSSLISIDFSLTPLY